MKKNTVLAMVVLCMSVILFFIPIFSGKLPIPSDTIIGLYHPFRDLYAKEYPNGIAYKNFLITDPVRQQYPWKNLVIESMQKNQFPLWNPYAFSGTPLLANIQSAPFYPLNLLFLFMPIYFAWSIQIFLQPLLATVFLYMYLRNIRVSIPASVLGGISFAFSGFFIAWLEWGTVLHVALWLPLILFCIDKIFQHTNEKNTIHKYVIGYTGLFLFSFCCSLFAGHIQTFFYIGVVSISYILFHISQNHKKVFVLVPFGIAAVLFMILTYIQWYPTMQLILHSARDLDQADWTKVGWFIPWQHSIQFLVPDFFGNPATLNYWGEWNYAEFIGYIGIVPLVMALQALFFRRDKNTFFFAGVLFFSLMFAFPTFIAKLPFILALPFISTAQPTRLIFLIDFSLAILAAFGFDHFFQNNNKKNFFPISFVFLLFTILWGGIFGNKLIHLITPENLDIAKRNMVFPSILFGVIGIVSIAAVIFNKKKYTYPIITIIFIGVTIFDLFRFGTKFTPFTEKAYVYPPTTSLTFLQKQEGQFRYMTTDSQILPPNFSSMYHLQSVDGYDPIYLRSYGELIAASERKKPDITPPFGFNRIITPHNYNSRIIDLLNVTYVLSLTDINDSKLTKVFQEGETRIYKNKNVLPRTFFVEHVIKTQNKIQTLQMLFDNTIDLKKTAITDDVLFNAKSTTFGIGKVAVIQYESNRIVIHTENNADGFLILGDIYYPLWHVMIDEKPSLIYKTDYSLRGVVIPKGKHMVIFYTKLFI